MKENNQEINIKQIKNAIEDYKNSSWYGFGYELNEEELINEAKEKGIKVALEKIRRANIHAFHMEEGASGNI